MYSCTKKRDRYLKHATLFRYKRLWKRDRTLFKEDFFPLLQEERCIKTTVLNTQLLLWWKNWFILWSKRHLHRWYLNLHLRQPSSRTKGCNHVGIWFKQKWIIVIFFVRNSTDLFKKERKKEEVDCDREKFTIGKGKIWPKKPFMDRPWGGGWAYIYIYTCT